jgi:hypothetical protein
VNRIALVGLIRRFGQNTHFGLTEFPLKAFGRKDILALDRRDLLKQAIC